MKPITASIVIATYRRPEMLRDTLASVCRLRVPESASVEVIVVDNDPAGSAEPVMHEFTSCGDGCIEVRYVHERQTGLSYARNRGIEEARGEIVGFLDDDIFVGEGWLIAMLDCFRRTGAASVGGRTLIHWEGEPQPALRACERQFGFDLGEGDRELRGSSCPGGGNAAFRRSVFAEGLRFSTELGRVGNVLLSGEDTEMFSRLQARRLPVWYCGGAVMRHRTGGERLTERYLRRQRFWFGVSLAIIDRRLHGKTVQVARAVARAGKALLLDAPRWLWGTVAHDDVCRLPAALSLAKQLGYLRATLAPVVVHNNPVTPAAVAAVVPRARDPQPLI